MSVGAALGGSFAAPNPARLPPYRQAGFLNLSASRERPER